jgi:hypothetical protein
MWLADINEGRSAEIFCMVRKRASKWPNMSPQRPHRPERCAEELSRGIAMTAAHSNCVGRFDQKLAAQRLFPSLSS